MYARTVLMTLSTSWTERADTMCTRELLAGLATEFASSSSQEAVLEKPIEWNNLGAAKRLGSGSFGSGSSGGSPKRPGARIPGFYEALLKKVQKSISEKIFGLTRGLSQGQTILGGGARGQEGSAATEMLLTKAQAKLEIWRNNMGVPCEDSCTSRSAPDGPGYFGNVALRILLAFAATMYQKHNEEKEIRISINAQDLAQFPQSIQGFSGTPPSLALHPRIGLDEDRDTGGYLVRRIEDIWNMHQRSLSPGGKLSTNVEKGVTQVRRCMLLFLLE